MSAPSRARCISDCGCQLGEGIFWEPNRRRIFWFDIPKKQMCSCAPDGSEFQQTDLPRRISAAAADRNGNFVAAADNGFGLFAPEQNRFLQWQEVEADKPENRTNDGRADPHGAFWFGTMEPEEQHPFGAIYRVSEDGKPRRMISDIIVPNAIAFSPEGDVMYWTDSPKQIIWRCALSPDGEMTERRVFVSLQGRSAFPDGAIVDAEGFLWNAEWDGWRVVRYSPDGVEDRVVEMPVARPTCPAFGGDDLSVLYVSSAREGLSSKELEQQPQAGGVFAFDAPFGLSPPMFGASTVQTS